MKIKQLDGYIERAKRQKVAKYSTTKSFNIDNVIKAIEASAVQTKVHPIKKKDFDLLYEAGLIAEIDGNYFLDGKEVVCMKLIKEW